ncbi:hypothetical protein O5641_22320 [Escherichia coli]|nr:hypothetical protein [Escherichia coli]
MPQKKNPDVAEKCVVKVGECMEI